MGRDIEAHQLEGEFAVVLNDRKDYRSSGLNYAGLSKAVHDDRLVGRSFTEHATDGDDQGKCSDNNQADNNDDHVHFRYPFRETVWSS